MDGLKPSQRKILFTMFERYECGEVRVSQLAGAVSQYCGYHHGEVDFDFHICLSFDIPHNLAVYAFKSF